MSRELIIIRGPSGTGKSTLASHLGGIQFHNWFEADMWMVDPDTGDYKFDRDRLGYCHNTCQRKTNAAMDQNQSPVIVSNTFITLKELKPYLELAEAFGYSVRIIRTPGPWDLETLLKRNTHNVPRDAMERFLARYVSHEDEEEWTDLSIYA